MPADGTPAIVPEMSPAGPLLVYGPRSTTYDFGLSHPLAKKIGAWPAVLSVTASETFSKKNTNRTIEETFAETERRIEEPFVVDVFDHETAGRPLGERA